MGQKRTKLKLEGVRFGRLLVISDAGLNKQGTYLWNCICDCGNTTVVKGASLQEGNCKSCGCLAKERVIEALTKHGQSAGGKSDEYTAWGNMKARCYNKSAISYSEYGGRGIKVCDRWIDSFENFYKDMGDKPTPHHSLDRFPDNDGDYEPNNCRWATLPQQLRNTRRNVWIEHDGKNMVITDWAKLIGISYTGLKYQLKIRSMEEAIDFIKNNVRRSKFRGISYEISKGLWRPRLVVNGERIKFGRTKNEYKAALMYNEAAIKYLGDKAKINVLSEDELIKANCVYPKKINKRIPTTLLSTGTTHLENK